MGLFTGVKQTTPKGRYEFALAGARDGADFDILAAGIGSPQAAEIDFGALTPTGGLGACSHATGDEGLVCANSLSFTANGSTFTATGYANVVGTTFTTATALTLKPENPPVTTTPNNAYDESGLGENAIAPTSSGNRLLGWSCLRDWRTRGNRGNSRCPGPGHQSDYRCDHRLGANW